MTPTHIAPRPLAASLQLGRDLLIMALVTILSDLVLAPFHLSREGLVFRLYVPLRMLFLVLVATVLLRRDGESWRDIGLTRPRRLRMLPVWVFGGLITAYLLGGTVALLLLKFAHLPLARPDKILHLGHGLGEYLYWIGPVTWGSAAFGEEMLFRGFFLTRFLKLLPATRWGAGLAVVMQAVLFGLMHLYYGVSSGAVLAAIYGAVFAVIYLRSGRNLWAGILLHGLIDTIGITLLFLRLVPA
ncbi:MAG: hypothetical protein JWP49_1104 [Phenylobacterium sp.]|nr:hypothetical protein [Phenylobacterium sp.]